MLLSKSRPGSARISVCVAAFALIFGLVLSHNSAEDKDFTLDEFYDIKKSVKSLQMKKASLSLEHERVKSRKLHSSLPKAPKFYGQDHFEQSFDHEKEIWTHVGRPVSYQKLDFISLITFLALASLHTEKTL